MEKDPVCLQLCCSCCMQLLVFEGVAVACCVPFLVKSRKDSHHSESAIYHHNSGEMNHNRNYGDVPTVGLFFRKSFKLFG